MRPTLLGRDPGSTWHNPVLAEGGGEGLFRCHQALTLPMTLLGLGVEKYPVSRLVSQSVLNQATELRRAKLSCKAPQEKSRRRTADARKRSCSRA
eukprot:6647377-Alexandrium_andersonii.AAC.1